MIEEREVQIFKRINYFIKLAYKQANSELSDKSFLLEQPGLLYAIKKLGPVNQKDIAQFLDIKPASLTPRLQKLEQQGCIERIHDENDKRIQNVLITDKGIKLMKQGGKLLLSAAKDIFECLDNDELDFLDRTFDRLIYHIKEKNKSRDKEEL